MKDQAVFVALNERDQLTGDHCGRVAGLSLELGRQCALSSRELRILRTAAAFHDVGKIGIPDTILKKTTPLTDDDWAVMKTHAAKSQRIIVAGGLNDGDLIGAVARHHHERFDGGGYPDGLAGDTIPFMARILAVADTYDALAVTRSYRDAVPHLTIMKVLDEAQGLQHDPYIYAKFVKLIEFSDFKASSRETQGKEFRHEDLNNLGH